ncbi:MAG: class B sortase [Clostridium fessum]
MENRIQPGLSFWTARVHRDASDFHSIFYGHHMKDGSRFSELIRLKDEDFFQKHRTAYLYFPDGKRRTLRLIAALTAGSQGERRRTEFADQSEMHPYIEEMTEGCWFRELPDGEVSHLYSFVTCSYEFADARTIVYAVDE